MNRPLLAALVLITAASGCSRLNPGTWLNGGGATPAPEGMATAPAPEDTRPRIAQVTELHVDHTPGGAIVRATGVAPTPGWYGAALVPQTAQDGTLTFDFRATPPSGNAGTGSMSARSLTAAAAVNANALAGASGIVVRAETNALSAR